MKIILKRVQTVEYKPDPKNYPERSTVQDILKIDLEGAKQDPDLVFQGSRSVIYQEDITGEVIETG